MIDLLKKLLGYGISFTVYFRWTGYKTPKENK